LRADPAASLDAARLRGLLFVVKTTYTLRELRRETASAVHGAESGVLVTVTRHETPVAHLISDERLGALLETLELAGNPAFAGTLTTLKSGKVKFRAASSR
jgi:antitoxin (DNA-binding transcriptional repressor) of toxin-antitoxin stability system